MAITATIRSPPRDVVAAFETCPEPARASALQLRDLIFETAADMPEVGPLTETLKWGQPAYLTRKGTTIRLGVPKQAQFGLFVHCQTRLISEFSQTFPGTDRIEGTRAVLFDEVGEISPERHGWLIARV